MIETKKPYSRGCVRLRSASPHDEPLVSLNMLSDRRDLERLMDAQRRLYRLMESPQVKSKIHLWFVTGYSERVRKLGVPSVRNWVRTALAAGLMDSGKWPRNLLHRYQLSPGTDVHQLVGDERALEQWVATTRGHAGTWPERVAWAATMILKRSSIRKGAFGPSAACASSMPPSCQHW